MYTCTKYLSGWDLKCSWSLSSSDSSSFSFFFFFALSWVFFMFTNTLWILGGERPKIVSYLEPVINLRIYLLLNYKIQYPCTSL